MLLLIISEFGSAAVVILLAIGFNSSGIFSQIESGEYFLVSGALFFGYWFPDVIFDLLWPIVNRRLYKKIGWKKFILDEALFYAVDKTLCPIIFLENAAALWLLRANFSETATVFVVSISQAPLYIIAFAALSSYSLLKREQEAQMLRQ